MKKISLCICFVFFFVLLSSCDIPLSLTKSKTNSLYQQVNEQMNSQSPI